MTNAQTVGFLAIATATLGLLSGCNGDGGSPSHRMSMTYEVHVDRTPGMARHVPETESYGSGEKFRFRVTAPEDGSLYVFERGSSGQWDILYPQARINGGQNFIRANQPVVIPPVGRGSFQFDATPGVENVIMCFSSRPVPTLEAIADGQVSDATEVELAIQRLEADGSHRGRFRKVQHSDHAEVVLTSPNPDAVIVNRMALHHRPLGE